MSIRLRLSTLEARNAKKDKSMTDAEMASLIAESINESKKAVHYALTHPNGCFIPPIHIGRSVEDITLEEIAGFENLPFAVIDDFGRGIVNFLLGCKELRAEFGY